MGTRKNSRRSSLVAQRAQVPRPQRIVFVCEHGTVKSVVALEYFNQLARKKGIPFEAISRGTHPDSTLARSLEWTVR
jgi:hypothetical protein